jgi:hypothetical protein
MSWCAKQGRLGRDTSRDPPPLAAVRAHVQEYAPRAPRDRRRLAECLAPHATLFRAPAAVGCTIPRRQSRAWAQALAGLVALTLTGCAADHPCVAETCDGRDNDCDGRSDEDFLDRQGRFVDAENCGGCGLVCAKVFASALATECAVVDGQARCRITHCKPGEVLAGSGACVPDAPVLCLPCASDDECALRSAGARCLSEPAGGSRCGRACQAANDCPVGFSCTPSPDGPSQCRASSGSCTCSESMLGADFACELSTQRRERVCAGVQHCTSEGLSSCEAALAESCNAADDDCDGLLDEDFVDAAGRYVGREHCGSCGTACVEPGVHMLASCVANGAGARCQIRCADGFVDVDGIAANGCECRLNSDRTPVVGGDQDCDGFTDPTPDLVFVSQAGDDRNSGLEPEAPLRSIARGMAVGTASGRRVLVARGIYSGQVSVLSGVTLVGGYSPDFREHDPELYPVLLEAAGGDAGAPVLRAIDIMRPTYVAGLTIAASDAVEAGQGSSAVLLSGCGPELELEDVTVLAGRGAAGGRGADSSDRLAERGLSSLAELAGVGGQAGVAGGQGCSDVAAGGGGTKSCGELDVSGGAGGAGRCAALSCSNSGSTQCGNAGCTDFTANGVCDIEAAKRVAVANPSALSGRGSVPGRAAEATYDAPTNHNVCSFCDDNPSLPRVGGTGGDGALGVAGAAGAGCAGALGLDADGRVQAGSGAWGADGTHGSGGGGGTAGAGYAVIGGTAGSCSSVAGGAGGGAGSGGCAAPGAAGGGGGGVSAGIVIVLPTGANAGPRLHGVRVVAASGGDGGDGGIGASGGAGGSGGLGGVSSFWCARSGGRGGDGGMGGAGGGGGGGCGGASLGIYVAPSSAPLDAYAEDLLAGVRVENTGAAGRGGRGGFSPENAGSAGSDGATTAVLVGGS